MSPVGSMPSGCEKATLPVPPIVLADHVLLRPIGQGSYGEVWLARNLFGTLRAVKFVRRLAGDRSRLFEREYEGLQRFEPLSRMHPGLVQILQVGRVDDLFYYVMELADPLSGPMNGEGFDYTPKVLSSLKGCRLPVEDCLRMGLHLAAALGFLHDRDLVHCDVKPSNVILVDGQPKLADVGLVSEIASNQIFFGTEGYVPPEGGGTVQADLYALGKLLYEISTGRDRRQYPTVPGDFSSWKDQVAWLELQEVVDTACSPDPKQRYRSAQALSVDLRRLSEGRSVRSRNAWRRASHVSVRLVGVALLVASSVLVHKGWRNAEPGTERNPFSEVDEAQTAYRMGVFHMAKQTPSGYTAALAEFESALALDPNFAEARGELAKMLALVARKTQGSPAHLWNRVRLEAEEALKLDPQNNPAWLALGMLERDYHRNLARAEDLFRRAIALRPRDAFGFLMLSKVLTYQERHEEAVAAAREAVHLDPTSPYARINVAASLWFQRRTDDAVEAYRVANQLHPHYYASHEDLAFLLLRLGRVEEAVPLLERAWATFEYTEDQVRARRNALLKGGAQGFFDLLVQIRLDRLASGASVDIAHLSRLLVYADRIDEALDWAEVALGERRLLFPMVLDPLSESLRQHPRYATLREALYRPVE